MNFYYISFFISLLSSFLVNATDKGHINSIYFPSNSSLFDYSKINNLIIFGDSYSQTDVSYDTLKYTGNNQSGGKDWPLHLIDTYDMYLWNFAHDGASMGSSYVGPPNEIPLDQQYGHFENKMTKGKQYSHWKSEDTLFVFWFGINDIRKAVVPQEEVIKSGPQSLAYYVSKVYENGARNILFMNIPPFDKSPWAGDDGPELASFIDAFNEAIQQKINEISFTHPDANIFFYNAMDEFNYLLENHQNLNMTNINECFDDYINVDLGNFFWYNALHPSATVHKFLADNLHLFLNNASVKKVQASTTHGKALANIESTRHDNKQISYREQLKSNIFILGFSIFLLYLFFF